MITAIVGNIKNIGTISIVFSMIIILSPYLLRKKFSISDLSGLAATFGIFGTFIGIFLGLLEFNVSDLSNSVPSLTP